MNAKGASNGNPLDAGNLLPGEKAGSLNEPADYIIHIDTGLVEVGPQHIISTTIYNGQFPGPLMRFKEGQRTVVDIFNDTDRPEQFHWHGQFVSVDVDGSGKRASLFISRPMECGGRYSYHGLRAYDFTIRIRWRGLT